MHNPTPGLVRGGWCSYSLLCAIGVRVKMWSSSLLLGGAALLSCHAHFPKAGQGFDSSGIQSLERTEYLKTPSPQPNMLRMHASQGAETH